MGSFNSAHMGEAASGIADSEPGSRLSLEADMIIKAASLLGALD